MIPWLRNAQATCKRCTQPFFYDTATVKRTPSICTRCKLDRVAKTTLARQEKLKDQVETISGHELSQFAIRTHAEVGAIMGITDEAVRRAERSALAKLQRIITAQNKRVFSRQ